MPVSSDDGYRRLARALREIVVRPDLENKLKASGTAAAAMTELNLTSDMRIELLNVLNDLNLSGRTPHTGAKDISEGSDKGDKSQGKREVDHARDFMNESFEQLRHAYRSSMLMSEIVFVIGIGFLLLAATQSLWNPDEVATTSVIAGVGVIQIVALFYRNPLSDIARTVSNAQRTRIAITSYLMGVTLVADQISLGPPTDNHLRILSELTNETMQRLQPLTGAETSEITSRLVRAKGQPDADAITTS